MEDIYATFYQSTGFLNLTDYSHNITTTDDFKIDSHKFTRNLNLKAGASLEERNKTAFGLIFDWSNPCNPRNFSRELQNFAFPDKITYIIPRIRVSLVNCPLDVVSGNIVQAVSSVSTSKWIIEGVYVHSDSTVPSNAFSTMFGWPTFNPHLNRSVQITIYSSEIVRVLSDIPSNSLGWLLEKSPSLKPSDIKEGVIAYQDLRISGIVPPENVETGNAAYFGWPILICFIVSIILVILYMKRRNKRNRANQAIELRTRAAVPQQKNLPVLSSNDLDQIPCALYDSIRIGTEKEKSPNPDETSSRSFNLVKRTLTALSLSQDSELSCSICIETFKPIDEVRKLPTCEHVFHKECIDNWLLEQSCCCPNCRFDLRIALGIDISDPAMETVIDVVDGAEDVEEEGPSAVVTDRVVDAREDSDPVQVVSDADQRELVPSTWQQINHADTEETAN